MNEPLEELYFNWLAAKVVRPDFPTPSLTFDLLLRVLHNTEFVWTVQGDDNRAQDGVSLRREFIIAADIPDDPSWRAIPASLLEMLIAFTRRAEFTTDIPAIEWFWKIMENLELIGYHDESNASADEIADILYRVVWRQYGYDGRGGLFPIEEPQHDQRHVEIWYQFCEYLVDLHLDR